MDLSLVDEGGLGVVGLWDAPSAGCWVFRCLFGVGVGNGDGLGYSLNMLFRLTLHTNPFQVPMYILCWFGNGCVANLSPLKRVVFRVVTF